MVWISTTHSPSLLGHPPAAHAQPEGRTASLRMEHLQQLLRGQHQVAHQAGATQSHLLPSLCGGRGHRAPRSKAAQGTSSALASSEPLMGSAPGAAYEQESRPYSSSLGPLRRVRLSSRERGWTLEESYQVCWVIVTQGHHKGGRRLLFFILSLRSHFFTSELVSPGFPLGGASDPSFQHFAECPLCARHSLLAAGDTELTLASSQPGRSVWSQRAVNALQTGEEQGGGRREIPAFSQRVVSL